MLYFFSLLDFWKGKKDIRMADIGSWEWKLDHTLALAL